MISKNNTLPVVGITHGDVNGISYEIILKSLANPMLLELCIPVIYGSSRVISFYRKLLNLPDYMINITKDISSVRPGRVYVYNVTHDEIKIDIGKPTEVAAVNAIKALDAAIEDAKKGSIDVLVTAPLNKHTCQEVLGEFTGHTGYLAQKFSALDHLMMMISPHMRLGLVTEHVALKDVSSDLTLQNVLTKINLLYQSLRFDFGIYDPNIAVLSLNPHGGDEGTIGMEEKEILIPAIQSAFTNRINVFGPFSADGFFGSYHHRKFDGVLAIYHDQGLIPFKLLGWEEGVNYTMGLPIVRTSPAHGVAYDIAGQNKASERSMTKAIMLGLDILQRRLSDTDTIEEK